MLDWHPWQTAAFLDAQRRGRPVLLLIETAWAPACAAAHAHVLSRPDVCLAVEQTCIPVRVDADRRPDIADRYGLGEWPTLLFLTPDGHVLTGGTRLDDTLATRVRQVARAFASHEGRWPSPGGAPEVPAAPIEGDALEQVAATVWATREGSSGAFMHGGVRSAVAARFALAHASVTGSDTWAAAAVDTLEAIRHSPRWSVETGLLSLCPPAGESERLVCRLEEQAEWVLLLARALQLEPRLAWTDTLARAVGGLSAHLRKPDGHWRPWSGAPRLVLVDASARACRAMLAAAQALEDAALAVATIETLDALALAAYARGAGVAHLLDGDPRGPMLLTDAMLLGHALLDADPWRDSPVYRDLAEEILRTTITRLRDGSGAMRDRVASLAGAGQVGRLAEPHYPLDGNAEAVRLIRRVFPADEAWRAQARDALAQVSAEVGEAGVFAAPVGLAWHALGPTGDVMAVW